MSKDKVITFDNDLCSLSNELSDTVKELNSTEKNIKETKNSLDSLIQDLLELPGAMIPLCQESYLSDTAIEPINLVLSDLSDPKLKGDFKLNSLDVIVSITAGVIASIIDIVLVGRPEVVKLYRGGENFDGSVLTAALRKVGNGDDKISELLKWLSNKCVVPYDLSIKKGVVIPNNHRLRNLGHDPLLGLLFAVTDIILGTATLIDNDGNIRIIVRDKDYPPQEKYLAVIYYLGHLLSDMCTSRGLPIPGFVLSQFFTNNEDDKSIAKIAEEMYKDGYDLRHLASMSTPVVVKNMIIDTYIHLFLKENKSDFETIAEKEIRENKKNAYKCRLRLVSDAVSCGGNVLKFFTPPTSGNITALNLPEWASLISNTIAELKYQLRDKSVEEVIHNREIINDNWFKLLD